MELSELEKKRIANQSAEPAYGYYGKLLGNLDKVFPKTIDAGAESFSLIRKTRDGSTYLRIMAERMGYDPWCKLLSAASIEFWIEFKALPEWDKGHDDSMEMDYLEARI